MTEPSRRHEAVEPGSDRYHAENEEDRQLPRCWQSPDGSRSRSETEKCTRGNLQGHFHAVASVAVGERAGKGPSLAHSPTSSAPACTKGAPSRVDQDRSLGSEGGAETRQQTRLHPLAPVVPTGVRAFETRSWARH